MKKHMKTGAIALMLLALGVFTSCSMVFYGGITGRVIDSDNNGLSDIKVYLYLDKEAWENAGASYVQGEAFKPTGYADDTYTLDNGTFAFDKVMWKTGSSDFGTVADKKDVYLLFFSDDYGVETQAVEILSETKNTVLQEMDKKTDSFTYRLNFVNAANVNKGTGASYTLKYSYDGKPGETGTFTDDLRIENGTGIIPVSFYKNDEGKVPEVTITEIRCLDTRPNKTGEDVEKWKQVDDSIVLKSEGKNLENTVRIKMNEMWWDVPALDGKVMTKTTGPTGDSFKPVEDAKVYLVYDGAIVDSKTVTTDRTTEGFLTTTGFSGLGWDGDQACVTVFRTAENSDPLKADLKIIVKDLKTEALPGDEGLTVHAESGKVSNLHNIIIEVPSV